MKAQKAPPASPVQAADSSVRAAQDGEGKSHAGFIDNRGDPAALTQSAGLVDNSRQARQHKRVAGMMDNSPRVLQQRAVAALISSGRGEHGDAPVQRARPVLQNKQGLPINHAQPSEITQLKTEITYTEGTIDDGKKPRLVGKNMVAKLDPEDPVQGTATGKNWTWMRALKHTLQEKMIRGHLLNHDLGGFGIPANLYPITHRANMDHKNRIEYPLKATLTKLFGLNKKKSKTDKDRLIYEVRVDGDFPNAKFHIGAKSEKENDSIDKLLKGVDGYDVVSTPGSKSAISQATHPNAKVPANWHHQDRRQVEGDAKGPGDKKELETLTKNGRLKIIPSGEKTEKNELIEYVKRENLSGEDRASVGEALDLFREIQSDQKIKLSSRAIDSLRGRLHAYWRDNMETASDDAIMAELPDKLEAEWLIIKNRRGMIVEEKAPPATEKPDAKSDAKPPGRSRARVRDIDSAKSRQRSRSASARRAQSRSRSRDR
jgi:hypothetical protein